MLFNRKITINVLLLCLLFVSNSFCAGSFLETKIVLSFEKYEKFTQHLGESIMLGTLGAVGIIYMFQGIKKFIYGNTYITYKVPQQPSPRYLFVPGANEKEERSKGLKQALLGATAVGATFLIMANRGNNLPIEIKLPHAQ